MRWALGLFPPKPFRDSLDRDVTRPGRNHLPRAPWLWEGNNLTGFGARGNTGQWETLWQRAFPALCFCFQRKRAEIVLGRCRNCSTNTKNRHCSIPRVEMAFLLGQRPAGTEQLPGNNTNPRRKCLLRPQPWGEASPKSCPVTQQPLGVPAAAPGLSLAHPGAPDPVPGLQTALAAPCALPPLLSTGFTLPG